MPFTSPAQSALDAINGNPMQAFPRLRRRPGDHGQSPRRVTARGQSQRAKPLPSTRADNLGQAPPDDIKKAPGGNDTRRSSTPAQSGRPSQGHHTTPEAP